ncbi:MAG: ABC transporter substrate-binding protein, partial [Planctomycetota bacterium]|nr:ABC transporter substrate-binding protein [Planctomycetota bacterium]
ILFVDAQAKLTQNQPEHALALVESLHARNPNFMGLNDLLGKLVNRLTGAAVAAADFRQARFFIKRAGRLNANHPAVVDWTDRLTQQGRDLLQQAIAAESAGDRRKACDLAEQTARVWPNLQELVTPYARISNRWQRLRVGVVDLAAVNPSPNLLVPGYADIRQRQLTSAPMFQPFRLDDRVVRFKSRFLTDWEPRDLGHTVHMRLRPWQMSADSQPLLTAFDLSQMFADRILPGNPKYDARLGAMVERVEIDGPFEVSIHLAQVPLRPEVLLALPVETRSVDTGDGESDTPASLGSSSAAFPFLPESSTADTRDYRRSFQQPDGLPEYHVAEVIERQYPDYESAIQGIMRGDVVFLPRIPLSTIRQLEPRKEYFVQAYALPTTHFLSLNHRRPVLRLRSFRRALVYALDRTRVLQDVFLNEPPGELGRLTSAPWATRSYAYSPVVPPHQFDVSLAFSLAHTAERELDAPLPELKVLCPSDPEIVAACQAILAAWKRIGVQATLTTLGPNDPAPSVVGDDWDIVYRATTLAEPAAELAPLLTH